MDLTPPAALALTHGDFSEIMLTGSFLIRENSTRAWAEAAAVSNLRTPEGWQNELSDTGFKDVRIVKLKSKYKWAPEPLSIQSSH